MNRIAAAAVQLPLLDSKLWFHHDIRDNFYYASYLLAAAALQDEPSPSISEDREAAKRAASSILLEVLRLQDVNPESSTYGHWPLRLEPSLAEAPYNTLPVELMGLLMVYLYKQYGAVMDETLRSAFETALHHAYKSGYYRKPLKQYNHHEAKYTAAKLIYGQLYADAELLEDGLQSLRATLAFTKENGMLEYGSLPWFWHWVQAYTCAWELAEEGSELRAVLAELLDLLWEERSDYYLGGAWAGPHSRGQGHDIPRDANVLLDYVQFGNFALPAAMPRTEYAGFLFYEAPELARRKALSREVVPVEVKKLVPRLAGDGLLGSPHHSYVYITEHYAVGGMWERAAEFDNEQHRWDITLPLDAVVSGSGNQGYFFNPGDGSWDGDPRHQSEYCEVLLHENVVMALYPLPSEGEIRGILPLGDWQYEERALYGFAGGVYWSVQLMLPYEVKVQAGGLLVSSRGIAGGVVVEVLHAEEAAALGVDSLEAFAAASRKAPAVFQQVDGAAGVEVEYTSLRGNKLHLRTSGAVYGALSADARVNGRLIDWESYRR